MTSVEGDDERVLDEWCEAETRYWTDSYKGPRTFAKELERLNENVATIFIIDIVGQSVGIRPKPRFYLGQGTPDNNGQEAQRARLYRSFCNGPSVIKLRVHPLAGFVLLPVVGARPSHDAS